MPPLRRLSALRSHLLSSSPAAADRSELISSIAESAHELADAPPRLLDDDQLQQFIRDGAVELELAELPASFHAAVAARAQEHHKSGRWPQGSNNIYTLMPELRHVFQGPTCRGALQSVLGERHVMHAHRHMHVTNMNSFQNFHKDGQSGHGPLRHHRPRWAMIMYYPGGAALEMGPTAIIPSSNMLSIDDENWQPIVDPDGDADAPRPTELSPELHEYKVISPAGQPRAIMIHVSAAAPFASSFEEAQSSGCTVRHAAPRYRPPRRRVARRAV